MTRPGTEGTYGAQTGASAHPEHWSGPPEMVEELSLLAA